MRIENVPTSRSSSLSRITAFSFSFSLELDACILSAPLGSSQTPWTYVPKGHPWQVYHPPIPPPAPVSSAHQYEGALPDLSQKLLKHPWLFRLTHVFSLSADPVSSTSKCIQNLTTSHQQATLRPPTFPPPLGSAVAASPYSASTLVQILYRSATWEALSVFSEGVLRLCSQLAHSFLPHSRKARIYPMA